ncbi:MAG: tetratricopeptide repeat-containing sensor histidine kinase [Cyclobacteriaceae bacterium]
MIYNWRKRTIILIAALGSLFYSYEGVGQDVYSIQIYKDSLLKSSASSNQIQLLNKIGIGYVLAFPDSTTIYCQRAQKLSVETDNVEGWVNALNYQAIANASIGNISKSLVQHNEAISVASAKGDSILLAESRNYLGRYYLNVGNLADAFENFAKARLVFENKGNGVGLSEVYISLSNLFRSQQDYTNSLAMANEAFLLKEELDDKNGEISALNVLGDVYRLTGNLAQAETSFRQAEALAGVLEDEAHLALIKLGLGVLYLESGSLSKAETEVFRAANIITRLSNPSIRSRSTLLLGKIFLKKKNYAQAESYFMEALTTSSQLKQLSLYMESNFYLARLHELTGRDASAAVYESQYRILNDSIRNSELALQAEKFNFQLDLERKDQENALLKAVEQRNEATIKFQQVINFGALLVIILILFFSYFLWQSMRARKRVNKKLSDQNQQLVALNEEKDALMSVVAHDLKTPLSNIKSILSVFPGFGPLTEKQQEFTGLINTSSIQGLTLIDELLDAHELESQYKPNISQFNIGELLDERTTYFQPKAKSKGITLLLNIKDNVLINTDKAWLGRVVDNLISNAIKFAEEGKAVTISAGKAENEAWISIKDEGPGFSEEDKARAFQKFKKLSAKPTGGESSNGLGLSIVKTLVTRLKGTIDLLSEQGAGSEFIIRIPLSFKD